MSTGLGIRHWTICIEITVIRVSINKVVLKVSRFSIGL